MTNTTPTALLENGETVDAFLARTAGQATHPFGVMVGRTFAGYRVVARASREASFERWRAVGADGEPVDLVVATLAGMSDDETLDRLDVAAHVLGEVRAPGLPSLRAFIELAAGPMLALDAAPRETLADRVRTVGRLHPVEAARVALSIAAPLAAMHAAGFVYRDLRPENIVLEGHGVSMRAELTAPFDAAGPELDACEMELPSCAAAPWTSPEHRAGERNLRADQYALAAVLFAAVTGPYDDAGDELRVALDDFASGKGRTLLRMLPAASRTRVDADAVWALERALRRALSPMPVDRFASMEAFADAVRAAGSMRPRLVEAA